MINTMEKITDSIEGDITSQIPPQYLNHYLKLRFNGNVPENGELELSNGWNTICRMAYNKCPGPMDKKVFNEYCVFNRGSNVEHMLLSMEKFIQNNIKIEK